MVIKMRAYVRRLVCIGAGLLVGAVSMCGIAAAQAPAVTTGSIVPIPSNNAFSQVFKVEFFQGNAVALDTGAGALYQLTPGATAWNTLVAPGTTIGAGFSAEGMAMDATGNLYIGIRYGLTGVGSALFLRVPYDPSTNSWKATTSQGWGGQVIDPDAGTPGTTLASETGTDDVEFLNSPAMDGSGTLYFTTEAVNNMYSLAVDNQGNPAANSTTLITGMKNDAATFKVDPSGNVYLVERHDAKPAAEVIGLFFISAKTLKAGIQGTGVGDAEAQFTQIDPGNPVKYAGVTLDAFGDLFMDSESNSSYGETQSGIWEIPNGCSATGINDSNVLTCYKFSNLSYVSPLGGNQPPLAIDSRGYIWVPSYQDPGFNGTASYPNVWGIAVWAPGSLNLGAQPVGTPGGPLGPVCADGSTPSKGICANNAPAITAGMTFVSFNKAVTPGAINFVQSGSGSDFAAVTTNPLPPTSSGSTSAIPCTVGTAYTALQSCPIWVALDARAPGGISGQLVMLDSSNNLVSGSTTNLTGTGLAPEESLLSLPAATTVAAGLDSPEQVASDAAGDTYVADSGLHKVLYFSAGSSAAPVASSVGKNLVHPTGVAVDGVGNVYIADSGNVYEVPAVNGVPVTANQITLAQGLGSSGLNLAVDGIGNVYVTDPGNQRVVKIPNPATANLVTSPGIAAPLPSSFTTTITVGSGFNAPSAVAVDSNSMQSLQACLPNCTFIEAPAGTNDVFVADGQSLYEITPWGQTIPLTSSLAGSVTGLAVDASGSIIVAQSGGLLRIPSIGGVLTTTSAGPLEAAVTLPNDQVVSVSAPNGVALDQSGNIYVTDETGGTPNLYEFNVNGFVDFGNGLTPTVAYEEDIPLFNIGNEPLNVTGVPTLTNLTEFSLQSASTGTPCDTTGATAVGTGSSCTLGVGFNAPAPPPGDITPTTYAGSMTVPTNAGNLPGGTATANLQGTALAGLEVTQTSVSLAPPSSTFPGSTTATVTVTPECNFNNNGICYANNIPTGSVTLTLTPTTAGTSQQPISQTGQATGTTQGGPTTATFTVNGIPGGPYNVTASYGGNLTQLFQKSNSNANPVVLTVATATPVVTLSTPQGVQPDPISGLYYVGNATATTVTANVSSSLGAPTGTVTFMNGTTAVGTAAPDANGNAVFTVGALQPGTYNLTADYSGDQNFSPVNSAAISFQVIAPSVLISANPTSVSTKAGTPVAATLTLESLVGFSATNGANITCVVSTMPHDAECTFSNPQPDICAPSGKPGDTCTPATTVVTISTNIPVNTGSLEKQNSRTSPLLFAGLFGLGLLGLTLRRRNIFNNYLVGAGCLLLLLAGSALGITSCTNSGYTKTPVLQKYPTPTGTYTVSIIVTDPTSGQQESLPFTLGVTVQ